MTQNISAGRKKGSVTITVNNNKKKQHNVQKEQLLLTLLKGSQMNL